MAAAVLGSSITCSGVCEYLCKFGLVTSEEKATDAILRINIIVILNKSVPKMVRNVIALLLLLCDRNSMNALPFTERSGMINDRFSGVNFSKTCAVLHKHLVSSVRMKSANIDISCFVRIVKDFIKGAATVIRSSRSRNRYGDWRVL